MYSHTSHARGVVMYVSVDDEGVYWMIELTLGESLATPDCLNVWRIG